MGVKEALKVIKDMSMWSDKSNGRMETPPAQQLAI